MQLVINQLKEVSVEDFKLIVYHYISNDASKNVNLIIDYVNNLFYNQSHNLID